MATNERKELWRQENDLKERMKEAHTQFEEATRHLQITVDKNTWRGVQAAIRVAHDEKIDGFYGPLITTFKCDQKNLKDVSKRQQEIVYGTLLLRQMKLRQG